MNISFNLGRGQTLDHLSRANCQKKLIILHKNKQLEANIKLGKMSKTSHISETHALIPVSMSAGQWLVRFFPTSSWPKWRPTSPVPSLFSLGTSLVQEKLFDPFDG